jgi:hypothetical protein
MKDGPTASGRRLGWAWGRIPTPSGRSGEGEGDECGECGDYGGGEVATDDGATAATRPRVAAAEAPVPGKSWAAGTTAAVRPQQ